jgi:hypothetical protein
MAALVGKLGTPAPSRTRLRRQSLPGLGFGIVAAVSTGWLLVALFSAQAVFSNASSRADFKPQAALGLRPMVAQAPAADRLVRVSKFSRLSETDASRAERLAAAALAAESTFAALSAQRINIDAVKAALGPALAEVELTATYAALQARRPGAEAIRSILAPALEDSVIVAPRVASLQPDFSIDDDAGSIELTDAGTPPQAVEMAAASSMPTRLPALSAPLPVARPAIAARRSAPASVIEKDEPAPTVLAFARPDNPMRKPADIDRVPWPDRGKRTAIYDISAGVVHMPNGEKLEAHSGIGNMRDNPSFAHVKMRGPTPPGTYKITMRESLFHGVEAVRLTPTNGIAPLGRTGLLAHSYLLRTRGDSHGCVAFADYPRFLRAFKRGEVDMMVIVPRMGDAPSRNRTLAGMMSGA